MKREDLLKEMKDSVGTKDPIEFFGNMVNVFDLLFIQIESLQKDLKKVRAHSALAIQWEPKIASDMLARQVTLLREDKDIYANVISSLKIAYAEDKVTQSYKEFCEYWECLLGYHPFLD